MALFKKDLGPVDEFAPIDPLDWSVERYRWAQLLESKWGEPERSARFVEPVLVLDSEVGRTYRPLEEEPQLFEEFANTPDSAEGVLLFANRYGLLGITKQFVAAPKKKRRVVRNGESLREWIQEIRAARNVVNVWDCLCSSSPEENLRSFIQWDGDGVRFSYRRGGEILASRRMRLRAYLLDQWKRGETIGPARAFIASQVNRHLRGDVSPQLLLDASGELQPYIRTFNLLGAIWYQIYSAYSGGVKIRRCSVCNGWIAFKRKTKTMHVRCATRVRQHRFRQAREEA